MNSSTLTLIGQLAVDLAGHGIDARDAGTMVQMIHDALVDNCDNRITAVLYDAAFDLAQLQDELDDEACTCPLEPVRADMISPPERLTGRNRDCPIHNGIDPDYERDRKIDDRLTGDA